jgi:hypothetical protein
VDVALHATKASRKGNIFAPDFVIIAKVSAQFDKNLMYFLYANCISMLVTQVFIF